MRKFALPALAALAASGCRPPDPTEGGRRLEHMARLFPGPADLVGIDLLEPNRPTSSIFIWFHVDEVTDEEITARVGRCCARHTRFGATETAYSTPIPPSERQATQRDETKRTMRRVQLSCEAP